MPDKTLPVRMRRPGGRTEAVRRAVATTVLDLLGAGRLDFTVAEVAELSKVGRRTIHRRWPNRLALLREAIGEHNNSLRVRFSGDFHGDLLKLGLSLRDFLLNPREIALNRLLFLSDDLEFRRELLDDFDRRVTKPAVERFKAARQSGEISPKVSAETAWLMLGSSLFALCSVVNEPPNDKEVRNLVSAVLRMCETGDASPVSSRSRARATR